MATAWELTGNIEWRGDDYLVVEETRMVEASLPVYGIGHPAPIDFMGTWDHEERWREVRDPAEIERTVEELNRRFG